MGRLQKLKLENIRQANELLDTGHSKKYPKKDIILKPSDNVTQNSPSFVNKMNNLKEEDIGGMTSDPRIMAREYGERIELSPTQQKLQDDIMRYVGQTFGSWMSPNTPPFSQEYAQPPYFDKLSKGIRDIIINNVE
jgi:hypothetical protein